MKTLTRVLGQHWHVCAGQIPSSACGFWEEGVGGEAPSSIFIQQTVIIHLLCLSMTNLGAEGMETKNSAHFFQ